MGGDGRTYGPDGGLVEEGTNNSRSGIFLFEVNTEGGPTAGNVGITVGSTHYHHIAISEGNINSTDLSTGAPNFDTLLAYLGASTVGMFVSHPNTYLPGSEPIGSSKWLNHPIRETTNHLLFGGSSLIADEFPSGVSACGIFQNYCFYDVIDRVHIDAGSNVRFIIKLMIVPLCFILAGMMLTL